MKAALEDPKHGVAARFNPKYDQKQRQSRTRKRQGLLYGGAAAGLGAGIAAIRFAGRRKLEAPVSILKLAENNKKKVIAGVGIGAASVIAAREARNRIKARNTKGLEKTLRSGTDAAAKSRIASRSVVDPTQRAKASSVIAKRSSNCQSRESAIQQAVYQQLAKELDKKFAQAKAGTSRVVNMQRRCSPLP